MISYSLRPFKDNVHYTLEGNILRSFNQLWLKLNLHGELDQLFLPPMRGIPSQKDQLWESTCFELFMADHQTSRYYEFNISPTGDWNVFEFSDYRKNKTTMTDIFSPSIERSLYDSQNIQYSIGIPIFNEVKFFKKIGVSCVLKTLSGETHYWALDHPQQTPDFHDPRSFTINLPHDHEFI